MDFNFLHCNSPPNLHDPILKSPTYLKGNSFARKGLHKDLHDYHFWNSLENYNLPKMKSVNYLNIKKYRSYTKLLMVGQATRGII